MKRRKKPDEHRVVEVVKCFACNATYERTFEKGDYVYKEIKCSKCGGAARILKIFVK